MKTFLALLILLPSLASAASIDIYPSSPLQEVNPLCWGGLTGYRSPRGGWFDSDLQEQLVELGMDSFRWPDGSQSNAYNMWNHGLYFDEYLGTSGLNATRFIRLLREMESLSGKEASATLAYRFGTGSATDAADFAEFFMAPIGVGLGVLRDEALAASGIAPGPIAVRSFELGNEIPGNWELQWSWTAGDARKYFFGGDAWRRPDGDPHNDPLLPDWFGGWPREGDLLLRFPPLEPDSVTVCEVQLDDDGQIIDHEYWFETTDIYSEPVGAKAFQVKPDSSGILIGDGISYGAQPESSKKLIVEYKTLGHDGAIAMADSIRARLTSLGVECPPIGSCYPPWNTDLSTEELCEVLPHFGYMNHHWYSQTDPPGAAGTENMAYSCNLALDRSSRSWDFYVYQADSVETLMGHDIKWGITEWNVTLEEESNNIYGPAGAAFTALYLGNLSCYDEITDFIGAWHFATVHYGGFLHLFFYNGASGHSEPTTRALGYRLSHQALSGRVMPRTIVCEEEIAELAGVPIDSLSVPRILSLGSVDGDRLALLLMSSSETVTEPCSLSVQGNLIGLEMDLYTPSGPEPDCSLDLQTIPLGPGNSFFFDLPPRSLALLKGQRNMTAAPPVATSLVLSVRSSPSRSPVLMWSRAQAGSEIHIYDLRGRLVDRHAISATQGQWGLSAHLSSGHYWARLGGQTVRVLKLR